MGRIVVSEFVSLDGVMEDPGGAEGTRHAGWTFRFDRGPEGDRFKLDEVLAAEALLLGRVTYQGFAAAWPTDGGPGGVRRQDERDAQVRRLEHAARRATPPGTTARSCAATSWPRCGGSRTTTPGDLLVAGSAALVQLLVEHGLVDEYRLMVFPIVLGSGKRLFGEVSEPPVLRLDSVQTVGDGIVVLTYHPARADTATAARAGRRRRPTPRRPLR